MRKIIELKQKLNSDLGFNQKYTLKDDDKTHLLYVNPMLNATGYYRMIAQAMEINKTDTHTAIITNIDSNDFGKSLDDFTAVLDERLLIWADYIIFSSTFVDITYLLKAIKAINRGAQITMDVDQNYFALHQMSYGAKKITETSLANLEKNMASVDLVTVPTISFKNYLNRFIHARNPNANAMVAYIPNLVSVYGYEKTPALIKNTSDKFRVGIIKPTEEDVLLLKQLVLKMSSFLKGKIQIVCIGNLALKELAKKHEVDAGIEFHKTVSFKEYYQKLNGLRLDVALLPAKEALYNKHHSSYSYLELSVFGIPVIASIHHSSKLLLKEGATGFLANELSEWNGALELLIKNSALKDEVRNNALKSVWKNFSYNRKQLRRITEVFI